VAVVFDKSGGDSKISSDSSGRSSSDSYASAPVDSPPASLPSSPHLLPGAGSPPDDLSRHRSRSSPALHRQAASHDYQVPREKNRLTLRAFLRQLIKDKRLIRSKSLIQFLLGDPIAKLSKEEEADIGRRLEMDRLRLVEQEKFVEESRKRARELDQWLKEFKHDLIANRILLSHLTLITEGLTKLFEQIRIKESIRDLPPEYQKVAEWAKIEYPSSSAVANQELLQ